MTALVSPYTAHPVGADALDGVSKPGHSAETFRSDISAMLALHRGHPATPSAQSWHHGLRSWLGTPRPTTEKAPVPPPLGTGLMYELRLDERQEISVDRVGFSDGHTMRKALVGLQNPALHQLGA